MKNKLEKSFKKDLEFCDFEIDGIDMRDYPDFADAYILNANVVENGRVRSATESELDELNEDGDLVYEQVLKCLY